MAVVLLLNSLLQQMENGALISVNVPSILRKGQKEPTFVIPVSPIVRWRGMFAQKIQAVPREFFSACGKINSLELPVMDDGRSSGTAIIDFESADGAAAAGSVAVAGGR